MNRIIALVLSICILFGIQSVFAENLGDNNIIDTSALTEENILYHKMLNTERGAGLFSISSDDEITSDFDVVFGFDMSVDMYKYDNAADMEWTEPFKAIAEQAPANTRFAVVTDEMSGFSYDLDSSIAAAVNRGYNRSTDIISILDNCAAAVESNSSNNVIIAVTAKADNADDISAKINEISGYGIIPFLFILNPEKNSSLDNIDGVYQCSDDLELRIALSDLYLAFAEFDNASAYAADSAIVTNNRNYKSDFRPTKHKYSFSASEICPAFGMAMTSVLNIYKCLPLQASNTSNGNAAYSLMPAAATKEDFSLLEKICTGNLAGVTQTNSITEMLKVWDGIGSDCNKKTTNPNAKSESDAYYEKYVINSDVQDILEDNMKRRFPVIVKLDDSCYVVTGYKIAGNTVELSVVDYNNKTENLIFNMVKKDWVLSDASKELICNDNSEYEYNTTIFDTYKIIKSHASNNNITDTKTVVGGTLKLAFNTAGKTISGIVKDRNANVSTAAFGNDNSTIQNDESKLISSVQAVYTAGKPDIYNASKLHHIKVYTDVNEREWYYQYVMKISELGIMNGYEEDNGSNTFRPVYKNTGNERYGYITRGEFVKTVLEAAGINDIAQTEGAVWSKGYLEKAKTLSLLKGNYPQDDELLTYQDTKLTRQEAAYILYKLFIKNTDNILVPTMLFEYTKEAKIARNTAWKSGPFTDMAAVNALDTDTKEAIRQMFVNGVLDGSDEAEGIKFKPNAEITRAEVSKIITKCLFNLDEDVEVIRANITSDIPESKQLTVGVDGIEVESISFNKSNIIEYSVTVTDPSYRYYVETTDASSNDYSIAMRIIGIDDNKVSNLGISNSNYRYIVAAGVGKYTIQISRISGTPTFGLKIKAINAPQEVVFDKQEVDEDGKKHFYLFDDHPEFVRRCDILDDNEFEPTSLMHTNQLEPGVYTVFAYHHVAQENLDNKYTFGMPFKDQIVYFDSVFYNSPETGGDIEIKKIGISHGDNSWSTLFDAWYEFNNGSNIDKNIMSTRYIGSDPLFLTDIIDEEININDYNNINDMGFVWLMMEFEVKNGSVKYADVAYLNKSNAKSIFSAEVESKYEIIETVKGMGESSQSIIAHEMQYFIDDSTLDDTPLPLIVCNQLNGTSQQDMFTTNISPFTTNNRWTTPQSSEISIKYNGEAINRETGKSILAHNGDGPNVWYFDTEHSKLTVDKSIPNDMKIGAYEKKETIKPNEKFDSNWLGSIVSLHDSPFNEIGGNGAMSQALVQGLNGFGITHKYTVKIKNLSYRQRTFSYVVQGQDFNVTYSINGELRNLGEIRIPQWVPYSVEVIREDIDPGAEVTLVIYITLMTGSNPVLHNAFVIDGNINDKTIFQNDTDTSPSYEGRIYKNLNEYVKK